MWTQWKDKAQTKRIEKSIIGNRGDVWVPTMRKRDRQRVVTNESERAAFSNAKAAITELLSRVALSLQHLCYDQALPSRALCLVPLPALKELTCRIQHSWTQGYYDDAVGPYKQLSFLWQLPLLKHLHVVLKDMDWTTSIPQELPPSLERVCFSDLTYPGWLVYVLTEHKKETRLTHDSLRTILVSHKRDGSYLPDAEDTPVSARLFEYARKDPSQRIHMVEELEDYDLHRLRVEWLARVQGGEGCWEEGTPLALMKP
jgi:hypothetical protein